MTNFRLLALLPLLLTLTPGEAQTTRHLSSLDTLPLSALVGFEDVPDQQKQLTEMQGFLFQELSKSNQWRLVDQEQVVTVVHERAFQEAKTCSTSCMHELGTRLGAQTILLPDLSRQDGISRLSVREVSVGTGEILRSAQAETEEPLSSSSKRLAHLVVARLMGDPTTASTDSGAIRVITNAPARIWIDGEDAGDAPLTREVWPGVHRVSLEPHHSIPPARERPPPEPNFVVGAVFIFPFSSGGNYGRHGGYSQRPPAGPAIS